jgi:hypothetical protein
MKRFLLLVAIGLGSVACETGPVSDAKKAVEETVRTPKVQANASQVRIQSALSVANTIAYLGFDSPEMLSKPLLKSLQDIAQNLPAEMQSNTASILEPKGRIAALGFDPL